MKFDVVQYNLLWPMGYMDYNYEIFGIYSGDPKKDGTLTFTINGNTSGKDKIGNTTIEKRKTYTATVSNGSFTLFGLKFKYDSEEDGKIIFKTE